MKKLIYFTLNNNADYVKLAKLCIDSLYINGYDQDILFITNFKNEILKEIKFKSPVYFLNVESSNLLYSAANKLRIFEWEQCQLYSDILFCDLDILWMNSPDPIFASIEEGKICFSSDRQHGMGGQYHSGDGLFDKNELKEIKEHKLIGVNTGLFGFKPNLLFHFKAMYDFLIKNADRLGPCLEQPCLNVYCYRNKILSRSLTPSVSQLGGKKELEYFKDKDFPAIHFQGGPGNFRHKYSKMNKFYNYFFESK
jgi:hypothetical protein